MAEFSGTFISRRGRMWLRRGTVGVAAGFLALMTFGPAVTSAGEGQSAPQAQGPGAVPVAKVVAAPTSHSPAAAPVQGPAGSASGGDAVARLADRLPAVAERNGFTAAELREELAHDESLYVDQSDGLFYVEQAITASGNSNATPFDYPVPDSETFLLHSKPGSNRVIYLDFNGHNVAGTAWNTNGRGDCYAEPVDADGNAATFSSSEMLTIRQAWRAVAEDYAPFDIDVTTADPGPDAIRRSDASDQRYGTRVVITNSTKLCANGQTFFQNSCKASCGGVAYLNVFDAIGADHDKYQPALVFQNGVGFNAKTIAEATSHEVGHNLGLKHDGSTRPCNATTTEPCAYYNGQGAWAPIMGVGYGKPLSQWSAGEYAVANNREDDFAVMALHGALRRVDDHGNTTTTATRLASLPATTAGIIADRNDKDMFSFDATGGLVTLTATTPNFGSNLDIELQVLDATGRTILRANEPAAYDGVATATGTNASVSFSPAPGRYFVQVDGSGAGDPRVDGYSDYGSIGNYQLSVAQGSVVNAAAQATPAGYVPVPQCRIADTRKSTALVDLGVRDFAVKGACGIPSDAVAAELTVTAVTPSGSGYAKVYAKNVVEPSASFLNFTAKQNIANTGKVGLGSVGGMDLRIKNAGGNTHYIIDVLGYFTSSTAKPTMQYIPTLPCRVADTRENGGTVWDGALLTFQVKTKCAGVFAAAAEVTITAVTPGANGYAKVYGYGAAEPGTSFLNFTANQNTSNTGTVELGADDSADLAIKSFGGNTHYVIDVVGYFTPLYPTAARFVPVTPCRVADTRTSTPVADRASRDFQVKGACGVPANAVAAETTLTAVTPTANGYAKAFAKGIQEPGTTFLSFTAKQNIANSGTIWLGDAPGADLTIKNFGGTTHYVVDVQGYWVRG